ncbi:hypothetical protein RND81_08G055600 [Saponaria officinalis]|uniref:Uncharacterized protein n=1 Tax=Saponaria officinalis TaxID=3572 RepID=A0AAW1J3X0_SAPOF
MSIKPLIIRQMMRLVRSVVEQPTAMITTVLYYSNQLPQNAALERLVQHDLLLHQDNYFFIIIVNFLKCFV